MKINSILQSLSFLDLERYFILNLFLDRRFKNYLLLGSCSLNHKFFFVWVCLPRLVTIFWNATRKIFSACTSRLFLLLLWNGWLTVRRLLHFDLLLLEVYHSCVKIWSLDYISWFQDTESDLFVKCFSKWLRSIMICSDQIKFRVAEIGQMRYFLLWFFFWIVIYDNSLVCNWTFFYNFCHFEPIRGVQPNIHQQEFRACCRIDNNVLLLNYFLSFSFTFARNFQHNSKFNFTLNCRWLVIILQFTRDRRLLASNLRRRPFLLLLQFDLSQIE